MYYLTLSVAIYKPFEILHIYRTLYGIFFAVEMKSISILFLIAIVAIAMEKCKARYLLVKIDNTKGMGKKGLQI